MGDFNFQIYILIKKARAKLLKKNDNDSQLIKITYYTNVLT